MRIIQNRLGPKDLDFQQMLRAPRLFELPVKVLVYCAKLRGSQFQNTGKFDENFDEKGRIGESVIICQAFKILISRFCLAVNCNSYQRYRVKAKMIYQMVQEKVKYFLLEPVGTKAPGFSSDFKSFTLARSAGQSFGLLCQAQGFPVPNFRYFLKSI